MWLCAAVCGCVQLCVSVSVKHAVTESQDVIPMGTGRQVGPEPASRKLRYKGASSKDRQFD